MAVQEFTMVVWWKLTRAERKAYMADFMADSLKREEEKMSTLGPYEPKSDGRNMSREAQAEQVDTLSYMRFLERKHPSLEEQCLAVKRLAFETYCALRVLEKMEERLSK